MGAERKEFFPELDEPTQKALENIYVKHHHIWDRRARSTMLAAHELGFQAGVESVMDQLRLINYVKIAREFDAEKPQGTTHEAIVFALLKCKASLSLQGRKQEK